MDILQLLLYGVVLGSIVALGAVGVTLTFGILGFANFAHGDLMAFGAYVALVAYTWLALPLWLALPAAVAATVALALLVDALVFRRFRTRRPIVLLISSFGVALILRSLIQIGFGPGTVLYSTRIQIAERFWGLRVKPDQIVIVALTLVLVVLLHLFLSRTRTGKAMRAMADNPTLARSIRDRFPYLDPLHELQVDLLGRYRTGDDDERIARSIQLTINGIAAGLRNSG